MKDPRISSSASSIKRKARSSPVFFAFLAFLLLSIIVYGKDFSFSFSKHLQSTFSNDQFHRVDLSSPSSFSQPSADKKSRSKKKNKLPFEIESAPDGCDYFNGRWVRDESNHPLYQEADCPYIEPQLTCQEHGRPDKDYQFWRWQPSGCSIPSFNATRMLEAIRGKRMLFVGDSLNTGQYISFVCLVQSVIPENEKSMQASYESLTVFRAKNYNATIEFYWAPFLLESNSDNAGSHRVHDRIVKKGSINKHGKNWKGADIIVFNTYVWWTNDVTMKILRGSFQDETRNIVELSTEDAYRMAMKGMLRWAQRNMDFNKTRVFFTSMSPTHGKSEEWGGEPNGNCYNQTTMIDDPSYWGSDSHKSIMQVIDKVFRDSSVPISFLNITQLSSYRKEAHTSIYKKEWEPLTAEELANPTSHSDCLHWCLPGLQDTWNELLYANLFYPY